MWNRSFSGGCPGLIGERGREGEREEGGGDISDGYSITARMWNRSFSGGCPGLIGEGGRETERGDVGGREGEREGGREREKRGAET